MKEEPNTKCKKLGFAHAWVNITENIVYATFPPQYPPKKEKCKNCGLTRTHYERRETWLEYKQEEVDKPEQIITLVYGEGLMDSGDSGTTLKM